MRLLCYETERKANSSPTVDYFNATIYIPQVRAIIL